MAKPRKSKVGNGRPVDGRTAEYVYNPRNGKGQVQGQKSTNVQINTGRDDKAIGVRYYKADNLTQAEKEELRRQSEARTRQIESKKQRAAALKAEGKKEQARKLRQSARAMDRYDQRKSLGMATP